MHVLYPEDLTMREARRRYFEANGFGTNGNYDDAWVDFKLGPLPFPFPNTAGRVKAVRYHDLHHVVTGYATDIAGEFEISAWEIAAGCKGFAAAWVLNLGGIARSTERISTRFSTRSSARSAHGLRPKPALLQRELGTARCSSSQRPPASSS